METQVSWRVSPALPALALPISGLLLQSCPDGLHWRRCKPPLASFFYSTVKEHHGLLHEGLWEEQRPLITAGV